MLSGIHFHHTHLQNEMQCVLDYIGKGHYLPVAQVCRYWLLLYKQVDPACTTFYYTFMRDKDSWENNADLHSTLSTKYIARGACNGVVHSIVANPLPNIHVPDLAVQLYLYGRQNLANSIPLLHTALEHRSIVPVFCRGLLKFTKFPIFKCKYEAVVQNSKLRRCKEIEAAILWYLVRHCSSDLLADIITQKIDIEKERLIEVISAKGRLDVFTKCRHLNSTALFHVMAGGIAGDKVHILQWLISIGYPIDFTLLGPWNRRIKATFT